MENSFYQLPNIPQPWSLFDNWDNENYRFKHGINELKILPECFYYLEILTDLLQKYNNHYSFEKLPEKLKELSVDSSNLVEEVYDKLIKYSYRINFICPSFDTFSLDKVRQLLISEFLVTIPTDEEVEACASYSISFDIYMHISWVMLQISNWIRDNEIVPEDVRQNMALFMQRNWRKIPERYFINLMNQIFTNVYRIHGIQGYAYKSESNDLPIPFVLKEVVEALLNDSVFSERFSDFIAELHYRIGGPEPPPDEDED
jgi:hypothetical protein